MNCLEVELPVALCAMKKVQVLSLNGLGGAGGCPNSVKIPLLGTLLQSIETAEIPSCLWRLKNLTTLHLSGNGYRGEISMTRPASRLNDISLSHNRLGGTIPVAVQTMKKIDLSRNRLVGHVNGVANNSNVDTTLHAQVNRLSGRLPIHDLQQVTDVDILQGNMFSCETIPQNDVSNSGYICGKK